MPAKPTESQAISSILEENRVFPPPPDVSQHAAIKSMTEYEVLYQRSIADPEKFWAEIATELHWFKPWEKILEWNEPYAKWFVGAKTNLAYNCLDRHLATRAAKPAIIWEGEPGEQRRLTYQELHQAVCQFANSLKSLGIKQGDCIAIYMPMVPELAVALLACARIGAIHNVVFGGFSAEALESRINDSKAKIVITADGSYRRGAIIPLKVAVDEALANCPTIEKVIVYQRTCATITMQPKRDVWWHDLMKDASTDCVAEMLDSETPLFILYTSGSTGAPKGILHTTGGYMVGTYYTTKLVFDLKENDIYWCTADVGWITGHSYVIYGPLANGATVMMYEGAPNWPAPDRFWQLIEKYRISILYTAPTAIRSFIKWGDEWPAKHNLSSLRILGSVGEPINPEAWMWYYEKIGGKRCPIVDTWWQTETGCIMISPLPGATPEKPGSATKPLPGIVAEIVDAHSGVKASKNQGGSLIIKHPWPSMLRGIWGNPERYQKAYWDTVPHAYYTGDSAHCDADDYIWIMGRLDDVIKVSGHRLGTAEIESALASHPAVAEAAVVAIPDDITGQAIVAFVTLREDQKPSEELKTEITQHVGKIIGAIAKPKELHFAVALPKTRSGKIMRRLLRDVAAHKEITQDTSTLEDYSVLAQLQKEEDES